MHGVFLHSVPQKEKTVTDWLNPLSQISCLNPLLQNSASTGPAHLLQHLSPMGIMSADSAGSRCNRGRTEMEMPLYVSSVHSTHSNPEEENI